MASKLTAQPSRMAELMSVKQVDQSMLTGLLGAFDDDHFMKDILCTHAPEESSDIDVQSLFALVENILCGSVGIIDTVVNPNRNQGGAQSGSSVFKSPKEGFTPPLSTISVVGCELTCKALDTKNVRETMESVFHELAPYSWVSKAVLTLSAFALHYADFWRLAHVHSPDRVAESMAILRGLPAITKPVDPHKIKVFGELNEMVKTILEMTECIVDFDHERKDVPELSTVIDISTSVYQIVVSVLACSILFTALISGIEDYKGQYLPGFPRKVDVIRHSIKQHYENFKQQKAEIREYQRLLQLFYAPTDNVELIKSFLYIKDSPQPLFHGSKKATDKVESLKRKNVLLLITDLKPSSCNLLKDDLLILEKIYSEPEFCESQYEIMWIPVVDEPVGEELLVHFKTLQDQMPWYSAETPNLINRVAIKIIKEKWHFWQETMVVVLDQQGRVENPNAMNLIHVWGWGAFPFNESKGATLWNKPKINWFELLVTDLIVSNVTEAIKAGRYIFLYGGEDQEAVHDMEKHLKKITNDGVLSIEFSNVGKSQLFWTRLKNCMLSNLQTKANIYDSLMQDFLELYTNYKEKNGLAILCRGSQVPIHSSLAVASKFLSQYSSWKQEVDSGKAFDVAFKEYHKQTYKQPLCRRFYFPSMVSYILGDVKCPKCTLMMQRIVKFECCHGAH